jgi:isocitrate dehydrogenase (NAD+)
MRATDGLFLEVARDVAAHHSLQFDDRLVDNVCAGLVRDPGGLDVLVSTALYGDILSDLAASLVGGVGVAPGANFGDSLAIFEAVHGSAPRHAGKGRLNPIALILSGAMLLDHLGEPEAAGRVERAVIEVVSQGRSLTYDLAEPGCASSTEAVADAVAALVA